MSQVVLTAFTCGWITLPTSFFMAGEPGQTKAPATVYLLLHPMGLVLFDTGFGPRFERPVGTEPKGEIDLEANANIGERLSAIGVDPASIAWIINSHLHTDHAGGNRFLPNATVVVQDRGWQHAFGEADRAYHCPEYDLGQPFLRARGEHDLFGDGAVVVFPTPGHTPGHQSARVRTAGGAAVLSADCCNLMRSLDEMRLPDHCFDAELYMTTLRRLGKLRAAGARIFPVHDPEFWARVPQGGRLAEIHPNPIEDRPWL